MSELPEHLGTDAVRGRFPTLDHVWLGAALTIVLVRALAWPITPSDFWWQLAYGRWIVEHGAIPAIDHFSYTRAGEPYFDQPWLSQLLMFGIYRVGGATLSLVSLAAILGLTYAMLLRQAIARSRNIRISAAVLVLSLPVAMTNWSVRSQLFALPLFVAYLAVLEDWRREPRDRSGAGPSSRLWLLPALMLLWVNLHGSFVLGGLLITLYFVAEGIGFVTGRDRRPDRLLQLVLWGGLAAAAVLVNPRGPGVFAYVLGLVGNPSIQGAVEEWMAPTMGTIVGRTFFPYAGLVAVVALTAAVRRRSVRIVDLLVLATFFWLALGGERHVMWFELVSVPFLAEQVALLTGDRATGERQGSLAINRAFLVTFAGAVVLVLPPVKQSLPLPPELSPLISPDTPVASVRFLETDRAAPERLFHTEKTGSYLMWAARGRKVFIDARVELYPAGQIRDFQQLNAGIAVDSLLSRYEIDGLLLDNLRQAKLLEWALLSPEYEVRFEEPCCTYLVKR